MKKNDRPAALRLWQVRAVLAEGEICALMILFTVCDSTTRCVRKMFGD